MNKFESCVYHLFLSYSYKNKEIVYKIQNRLEKLNYKIWIDAEDDDEYNWELTKQRIRESHIIICFISEDYCNSKSCFGELLYAYNKKKSVLPITFDRDSCIDVRALLQNYDKFHSHKRPDTFEPDTFEKHFKKLIITISKILIQECIACSRSISNPRSEIVIYFKYILSINYIFFIRKT
jgi:hypothetical protein